jgi:hypothetical protein
MKHCLVNINQIVRIIALGQNWHHLGGSQVFLISILLKHYISYPEIFFYIKCTNVCYSWMDFKVTLNKSVVHDDYI